MLAKNNFKSTKTRELTITRLFDAPRELVFDAWTKPEHLAQWFGPRGFSISHCELDARPGGKLRIVMRAPDDSDCPMIGVFSEVVRPTRLVYTNIPLDGNDRPLAEGTTTVTFDNHAGKTKLVMHTVMHFHVDAPAGMSNGMEPGWNQTLDRLGEFVARPGEHLVSISHAWSGRT